MHPEPELLEAFAGLGSSFEIASCAACPLS
jgi:hypothetical protein